MPFLDLLQMHITKLGNHKSDKSFEAELRCIPWNQILENWDPKEIFVYLAKSPKLPCQKYEAQGFGEANITLFSHKKVSADLYFPGEIPTDFHQHPFHGAFIILQGKYIHETLEVAKQKKIKPEIFETSTKNHQIQKLKRGNIVYLSGFEWHRLWRENAQGVSLLIRKEGKKKIEKGIFFHPKLWIEGEIWLDEWSRFLALCEWNLKFNHKNINQELRLFIEHLSLYKALHFYYFVGKQFGPSLTLGRTLEKLLFDKFKKSGLHAKLTPYHQDKKNWENKLKVLR